MGKIFSISAVIVIFCCCILFGLPYVGVTMAGILVCILAIFIPVTYLSRPKVVKDAQKEVSKCVSEVGGAISEALEEISNDIQMELARKKDEKNKQIQQELTNLSVDEISIITEKNIDILKYVETKKHLKDAGRKHSPEDIISYIKLRDFDYQAEYDRLIRKL